MLTPLQCILGASCRNAALCGQWCCRYSRAAMRSWRGGLTFLGAGEGVLLDHRPDNLLLHNDLLLCSVLFYSVLFCSLLLYSVQFCSLILCSLLLCSVLFSSTLFCSVLFCSTLFRSVILCSVLGPVSRYLLRTLLMLRHS